MSTRFSNVKYDEKAQNTQQTFKKSFEELELLIEVGLPPGRANSLCLTALEEAYIWIGKAIRDDQISRNGPQPEQAERW